MKRLDLISIAIVILTLAIFVPMLIFSSSASEQETQALKPGESKLNLEEETVYLAPGIKIRQKDIRIANEGDGSLTITELSTSSDLVAVQLITSSSSSPEFYKKPLRDWQGFLNPDEEAILRITFDAQNFDFDNPKDQHISFRTNDKDNRDVKIPFTAISGGNLP